MSVEDVMRVMLVLAAIPVNLYAFFYAFRPWWVTPQGRALMVKAVGNVLVINTVLAYLLFGEYPGRDPIRIVSFGLFTLGITYLLVALLTAPGAERYPPRSWCRRQ